MKKKNNIVLSFLLIVLLIPLIFISSKGIRQIRDFFTHASGVQTPNPPLDVYTDSLVNGFTYTEQRGSTPPICLVTQSNPDHVSGLYSAEVDLNHFCTTILTQWDGQHDNQFPARNYTHVEFDMKGITNDGTQLFNTFNFSLDDTHYNSIGQVDIGGPNAYNNIQITNSWQHVSIPLTAFGIDYYNAMLSGIGLRSEDNPQVFRGHVLFDNIRFVQNADTTAPTLVSVRNTDLTHAAIRFSEPVTQADVTNINNYSITSATDPHYLTPQHPTSATLSQDGLEATITLAVALVGNTTYSFSVGGIHDLSNNMISPNPTVSSLLVTPVTIVSELPWLKTVQGAGNGQSGRIVQADNNQPVELRGVNILRNEYVYPSMQYEEAAFPVMNNNWHANIVTHGFASAPVVANDQTYLGVLDEYQRLAEQNGMYIIFTYYYAQINGDQPTSPLADWPNSKNALVALVQRYRNKSNVLFMLQAEPHSEGTVRVTFPDLVPTYNTMITAMRAVDNPTPSRKHLILASGDGYGRDISPVVVDEYGVGHLSPITADNGVNIVYSSHPYDTRDGSNDWEYFLPVADAGYTVLVTEFGTGGQMAQSDTLALMNEMNNGIRHIGWTAWIFDDEGCPCVLANRNIFTPSDPYGISVQDTIMSQVTRFVVVPSGTPIPTIPVSPTLPPTNTPVPPTPTRTPTLEPLDTRRADVNRDGIINAQDFNLYRKQQGNACTSSTNCADVNCDNTVSAVDYNYIRQYFGTQVTNAPACRYWSLTPTPGRLQLHQKSTSKIDPHPTHVSN